jgi:hypothetical protein
MGIGVMRMHRVEFWEMPLGEFFAALHFFYKDRETRDRQHAELVRLQTVTLLNIQLASKDRIKDPRKLWRFPWEAVEEERRPTGSVDVGAMIANATEEFKRMEKKQI